MLQFLKVFVDIVLWRRGPQDLPVSSLLLGLAVAGYVLVSVLQLALLDEPVAAWVVFVVLDPLLLAAGLWALLRFFDKTGRFVQAATAVFGTGAVLGFALFLPVQWLLGSAGMGPESPLAGIAALALVIVFALVTGRILQLATDTNLVTGVALALMYFLLINLLLGAAGGRGG